VEKNPQLLIPKTFYRQMSRSVGKLSLVCFHLVRPPVDTRLVEL